MAKTNAQLGFKTRYGLRAINSLTQQPVGDKIWVDNIVLNVGFSALGNEIAYQELAIGTSKLPPDPLQENLITPIALLPLNLGTFEQTIFETDGTVISRVSRDFIFKNFTFPSNARTLQINEIGLTGVTRAVLPTTFEISPNHWLEVTVEIDYTYHSGQRTIVKKVNKMGEGEVLTYNVTPFIYNPNPANLTGRGWALTNSVLGYVWDGVEENVGNRTFGATLGLKVDVFLEPEQYRCRFKLSGKFNTEGLIPGFIIRDVLNGGGFKFTFGDGLMVEEDDSIEIDFVFSWGPFLAIPQPPQAPQ